MENRLFYAQLWNFNPKWIGVHFYWAFSCLMPTVPKDGLQIHCDPDQDKEVPEE